MRSVGERAVNAVDEDDVRGVGYAVLTLMCWRKAAETNDLFDSEPRNPCVIILYAFIKYEIVYNFIKKQKTNILNMRNLAISTAIKGK